MMTDKQQSFEEDIQWAIDKCKEDGVEFNSDLLDDFAERVSFLINEAGLDEETARDGAFILVF